MKPVTLTNDNFENEVAKSDIPVLVDFWAPWCGPCKALAPIMEQLAAEYAGKLKIGKLDIDENNELAIKFGVRSIPTMLFFKGGQPVDKMVGAVPKAQIIQRLGQIL
jgi:thioredoxin 1